MTVEEHYAKLLQLPPPWEVTKVEGSLPEQRVTVWLRWPDGVRARCPECGEKAPVYDHMEERGWRHLSVIQLSYGTALRDAALPVREARSEDSEGAMGRAWLAFHAAL